MRARRWLLASVAGLLCAVLAGAVVWYLLPAPKHTVSSLLHVAAHRFQPVPVKEVGDFAAFQRAQQELVKSRFVLAKALSQPAVQKLSIVQEQTDPAHWLAKEILVSFPAGPEHMRIGLQGRNPEEMRILINAVTEVYLHEVANKEHVAYHDRLESLKKAFVRFDDKIQLRRSQLREALAAVEWHGLEALKHEEKAVGAELIAVKAKLRTAEVELAMLRAPLRTAEDMTMLLFAPSGGASLVLARLMRDAAKGGRAAIELRQAESRVSFLRELEKVIRAELMRLRNEIARVGSRHLEVEDLKGDIARWEPIRREIAKQFEAIEASAIMPRVSPLEPAVVHPPESNHFRYGMVGLAGSGTFALVFFVFWMHSRSQQRGRMGPSPRDGFPC